MSSSDRVNTPTSSPRLCTWIRIPSSLVSTTTGGCNAANAAATSGADCASIGRTGRPTTSPKAASAVSGSSERRAPRPPRARSHPASIAARRTASAGTPAASATASSSSASSDPCRSSPVTSPRSIACSCSVAAENRSVASTPRAVDGPGPGQAATSPRTRRRHPGRSATRLDAGAGRSASDRQPSPVRRCRSSPPRYRDTTATSAGGRPREQRDQQRPLGQPGPRRGDRGGRRGELGEQHPRILAADHPQLGDGAARPATRSATPRSAA